MVSSAELSGSLGSGMKNSNHILSLVAGFGFSFWFEVVEDARFLAVFLSLAVLPMLLTEFVSEFFWRNFDPWLLGPFSIENVVFGWFLVN
jgi:hypothetical protein